MRYRICLCLAVFLPAPGAALAQASLLDFSRIAGLAQKYVKILEDRPALTFWSIGVTDDAPRVIFRSEMAGPCSIRVTSMVQVPPHWGQLAITTYDFSRASAFMVFATIDDQARQSPVLALTDPRASTGSLHGKALACTSSYDLGSDPEPYTFCQDRVDMTWSEDAASREDVVKSLAAIAETCNLPALKTMQ